MANDASSFVPPDEPGAMTFGETNTMNTKMNDTQNEHHDDIAVNHFADAMKAKMAEARAKGRSGWGDSMRCPTVRLQFQLLEHLAKGDPRDVANFCMMLWARGERTIAHPDIERLNEIETLLRGEEINDPAPIKPVMQGVTITTTTYGLVAGLLREVKFLRKHCPTFGEEPQ